MRAPRAVFAAAVAVGIGIACKSTTSGGNTCESTGAQQTINATDSRSFSPATAAVIAGRSVCWQNLGTLTHSVTADNPADSFDVTLAPDYVVTKGSGKLGTDFHYHCRYHAGMTGVIQAR